MDGKKKIMLSLTDIYQMLISECRYGYTRNNHLMPGGAYDKVKRIIPKMLKADRHYALHTLKQICEECITDQLGMHFYDGEDDEIGNRKEAIAFVKWCLSYIHKNADNEADKEWLPYCYDRFLQNLAKDDEPRYNIYSVSGDEKILLTEQPISNAEYLNFIFSRVMGDSKEATYQRERIDTSYWDEDRSVYVKGKVHFKYHILTPTQADFYVEHI